MTRDSLIRNFGLSNLRVMVFVDGENFAIRLGAMVAEGGHLLQPSTVYEPGVYAWSRVFSQQHIVANGAILRTYYYTAAQGGHPRMDEVSTKLKAVGVGAPRVFKKARGMRSKRVDITLATDMLIHAARGNYDIAVLVAGDEDYIPLVEAVQSEGRGVHLWSIPSGRSAALVPAADEHTDITDQLLLPVDA